MFWTQERVDLLTEHYPKKGKLWCVENLGFTERQVRCQASKLGLKARGVSEAWKQKQVEHAAKLTGRNRPEQAEVMKDLHRRGVLLMTDETKRILSENLKAWWANNDHPRGFAGKKHNQATKDRLSETSQQFHANEPEAVKAERYHKMMKTRVANGNTANPRPGASWKGGWREIGGIRKFFRSRWEFNYACYLEWLKQGGFIESWLHEPETFWFEGILRGSRSYLPDFKVTLANGTVEYHEVKGWMDDRSATKIRRMAKYHPAVTLVVIDAKGYKALEKANSGRVPGWEV